MSDQSVIVDQKRKENLTASLNNLINSDFPEERVCVLLSGGADSTVVALAAHHLGKQVCAISYRLNGHSSWDFDSAENTAREMGWEFHGVDVPIDDPKRWFIDLIKVYGCQKKVEVENLYPFMFILDEVQRLGFSKVLTGFNSPLPAGRRWSIACKNDPDQFWKDRLDKPFDSSATEKCFEVAGRRGVTLTSPLSDPIIINLLSGLSFEETSKPYHKHHWKDLFRDDFKKLGLLEIGTTPGLQTGGGIQDFFAPLLTDPEINYRGYVDGNETQRLVSLVKLWTKSNDTPQKTLELKETRFKPYALADVNAAASKELFTVVTTFAGGGGSSTGYKLAGGKILLANEVVPEAVNSYRANYPDTPVAPIDIRSITRRGGRDYVVKWFKDYGIEEGGFDILDGSPPCSTFSTSGKGEKKNEQKGVRYSDITQDRIGMLIHDYVYIFNVMKPKVGIIENVPSIKSSDVFKYALERMRRWGYLVNYKVLVSSHFGVPQRRRRLFVVAVRPDVAKKIGLKNERDILDLYPTGSFYEPTIRDAFEGLEIDRLERNQLLTATRRSSSYELISSLPKDPPRGMKLSDVRAGWTSDFNLVRSSLDHPVPTLTQMGQQMGRGGVHHPFEDRVFTVGELLRLMGLPDDYRLTGSFDKKAERVGRMVPPLMTKALAEAIYEKVLLPSR